MTHVKSGNHSSGSGQREHKAGRAPRTCQATMEEYLSGAVIGEWRFVFGASGNRQVRWRKQQKQRLREMQPLEGCARGRAGHAGEGGV